MKNLKQIDGNKVIELKKEITLNQRKNEIKNDLKTLKIDYSTLDNLNLNLSIDDLKKELNVKNKGVYLLKNCNDENKDLHRKLRSNARNKSLSLIREILILKIEKKNQLLVSKVKEFILYYIATYTKNDFSKESFYSGNMEQKNKDTFENFIKLHKILIDANLITTVILEDNEITLSV